jgi:hypothetical protein
MFYNTAIKNVIHKELNNTSVFYDSNLDLYYSFISQHSKFNFITQKNQPYVAYINDNVIDVSQKINSIYLQNHVDTILLFHNSPPSLLKKEDKYILNSKIKNAYKIFFSTTIENEWGLSNRCYTFPYGVKTTINDATKNVILLNFSNNSTISQIYSNIKESIENVHMLSSIKHHTYDQLINLISDYRIAICIGNEYNTLACAGCGCIVLSNSTTKYGNIKTIKNIDNLQNLIEQIKENLQLYEDKNTRISSVDFILKNFPFLPHISYLDNIFTTAQKQGYIYE